MIGRSVVWVLSVALVAYLALYLRDNTPAGDRIIIVGGAVQDIIGKVNSGLEVQLHSSTPGSVHTSWGGVARNIASAAGIYHSAALLADKSRRPRGSVAPGTHSPLLLSCVGEDQTGDAFLTAQDGFSKRMVRQVSGASTATYLELCDAKGVLHAAIAATTLIEECLTPELIATYAEELSYAPLVVADGNLPSSTLSSLARFAEVNHKPLWFEPTSYAKAIRILQTGPEGQLFIPLSVALLSPNIWELLSLHFALSSSSLTLRTSEDYESAISQINQCLLNKSLCECYRHLLEDILPETSETLVLLTLGPEGIILAEREKGLLKTEHIPAVDIEEMKKEVAAGDSLVGCTAQCTLVFPEKPLKECVLDGLFCASLVIEGRLDALEMRKILLSH